MKNITVYDKTTHEAYEDVIRFEAPVVTLKWVHRLQPKGTEPIYAELKGCEAWKIQLCFAKILLKHELTPSKCRRKLDAEQRGIIEFMTREAGRSEELTILFETEMTVFADNPQIRFKTRFY